MHQQITPIPVRPWTLNGLSGRLIVSHYENNYGVAVRTLNAVRSELAGLDAGAPGYRIRALKREEAGQSRPVFSRTRLRGGSSRRIVGGWY
jgi:Fe-Mn family superoxide dismutase